MQKGRNRGISGLVDLPGYRPASGLRVSTFQVACYGFTESISLTLLEAAGRGDSDFPAQDFGTGTGTITLKAKLNKQDYPLPTTLRGQAGPLLLQFDSDEANVFDPAATPTLALQMLDVRIIGVAFKQHEEEQDVWDCDIVAQIREWPTWSGFGPAGVPTDQAGGDETHTDKILWGAASKTLDPKDIGGETRYRLRAWAVADNDDAEYIKMGQLIAGAAAPRAGLKLRPITLTRVSRNVTYINFTWSRTDTRDDVILPQTKVDVDPQGMGSNAMTCEVNAPAPTPAGAPFVLRDRGTSKLNDGTTVNTAQWGLRSTIEDIERPGSFTLTDPADLTSSGKQTKVYDPSGAAPTPTIPAGQQLVGTTLSSENVNRFVASFDYGKDTSQQKLEQDNSSIVIDANNIGSEAAIARLDNASPPVPAGLVDRGIEQKQATHDHTLFIRRAGLRSTAQDIEFPDTFSDIDPSDLESVGRDNRTYDVSGGPPADATPPAGLQVVNTRITRINTLRSAKLTEFAKDTSQQKTEQAETWTFTDPNALTSEAHNAGLDNATPATPAGFVDRGIRSQKRTHDHTLYIRLAGMRTTVEDETFPETKSTTDAQDLLNSEYSLAQVAATASPPGTPAAPGNVKIVAKTSKPLTSAGTPQSKYLFHYGKRDGIDEIELEIPWRTLKTHYYTDPNGIKSTAVVNKVDNAAPTVPAGLKQVGLYTIPLTQGLSPDHTDYVLEAGLLDSKDEIQMPGTTAEVDSKQGISTQTLVTTCNLADTPDTLLATLTTTLDAGSRPWKSARLRKENDLHAVQRVEFFTDDKSVAIERASSRFEERMLDPTGTFVRVPDAYIASSGLLRILLQPYSFKITREIVRLRRYIHQSNEANIARRSLVGTRGNSSFLGYEATLLSYIGHEIVFSWADEGGAGRWLAVDYLFEAVFARNPFGGIVDVNWSDSAIPRPGWYDTDAGISVPGTPAASAIDPTWVVTTNVNADYSVFLA